MHKQFQLFQQSILQDVPQVANFWLQVLFVLKDEEGIRVLRFLALHDTFRIFHFSKQFTEPMVTVFVLSCTFGNKKVYISGTLYT